MVETHPTSSRTTLYVCQECGDGVKASENMSRCPECGGVLQNTTVPHD
ncbi:rubrerythrin-like domain-containing protein [Halalkaliarchaeum sp. AArc-GB]|nr:rubrerythrin-like domain-containing protein [Halalkaliarchaeum sp. AArc-GB]MDR5674352.1 rubrerythrin-like domain-containing protein [Halalkaliarchaeum sp. AArc-GB]